MFDAAGGGKVLDHPSKARGRKDASGQEKVIETGVISERIDDLVKLYLRNISTRDQLNDAIKSAAEDSGLLSGVVRKFIIARAQETLPAEQRKAEQLCLLFLDVGA